ncbi:MULTISPECIES: FAD-dependent oxidoreductase [Methylocaldum]|jgi:NADPH-dependent glutamate synthase beta subunit-like oxidoreductase/NAD(P)H-flavin reductase|uniref:FAD-dependent oxidoreductase n=1 Tax=Methylocaldum sp. RMAD-M TaxID=2806557 RepID=UPI000A32260E|nr:FAD-dependent oxidoreductase [Methylocaldum sp. RMAD-M]MBP1148797.1 NADPH-dependent glutamate synthase beta subunit-like oxidoreductase/NAD(P)H-flavin reductase [Methylocaldum sp. RMAD-M]MVF20734.1 pyridine nucleotide-disulfide oxidoreductase [Methylocaldum sp. BRCS4]
MTDHSVRSDTGLSAASVLTLGISGFNYADLYEPERLKDLSDVFDATVRNHDPALFAEFERYRACQGEGMPPEKISDVLVKMAPYVGTFVARLFGVSSERDTQIQAIRDEFDSIFLYRNEIVGKVAGLFKNQALESWNIAGIQADFESLLRIAEPVLIESDREKAVAVLGARLHRWHQDASVSGREIAELRRTLATDPDTEARFAGLLGKSDEDLVKALLDLVQRWTYAATQIPELKAQVQGWASFKFPAKTDFNHLVHHETRSADGYSVWAAPEEHHRRREGFGLTDPRFPERRVLYEVDHCIYCHDRDTDSCSKGMRNKKDGTYKTNPLGVTITGCPLEEKISEMHVVKRQGDNIGALALITIDNPLCPGTGHRICNDCMKGCIYQKTEPVNIPQIETNVLTDVLFMPWGFEIYSLLTRWNPLNVKRPYALPYNGKNVLVAGMGPAGYTLAHYLTNEGFGVVGIDGLKIEPLPKDIVGDETHPPRPIHDFRELYEDLDKRIMLGFGGVAEYGITVRWDKNFLKVIYLTLLRRHSFRCYGGVRFGGTLTINEAWDLGFDHIAIASGAGKPTLIDIKNNLIRGIRKASDFLMALQLTGAAKESSLANLQVRLPAGVIGGGLTAIDTATELLAYYPVQVEKIMQRYEKLCAAFGEETVRARYDEEELLILDEFLGHAKAVQAERQRAQAAGEKPDFLPLLNAWGGVTLFYRKGMKDSPAYRQNHEEIKEAMDEGILLAEGMNPLEALEDKYGHLRAVRFEKLEEQDGRWQKAGNLEVPLRSLFVAAGTSPNTIYESEHPDSFEMDQKFYQRYEPNWLSEIPELEPVKDTAVPKIGKPAPFTSYRRHGKFITFYGDNHPVYAGNVVKAMASAKDGYPYIVKLYEKELAALDRAQQPQRLANLREFQHRLDDMLLARIVEINRVTPNIVEVIVRAPLAAKHFCPGQFYRVQNFEALAPVVDDTVLVAEGLALTGAWVDKEQGLISLIALEMGSSSKLCAMWKPGDPIVVMGVTGAPTEIHAGQTVLLAGGGLGNAVLFSIGKALRAAGSHVIYFAGYRKREDVFKIREIEAASDVVVWSVDNLPGAEPIPPLRPQDKTFVGNIVEAMLAYAKGELGPTPIHMDDVDHMIVIGSDRMMAAVKAARYGVLQPYLKAHHSAIGSINSPMQCMMKGVCAQCLCKHVEPDSGKEYFVYSCYNQDQDLDRVDFPNLYARLRQNSVQEKLSTMWLDYLLSKNGDRRVG